MRIETHKKMEEELYRAILHDIVEPELGKNITYGNDLERYGKRAFGRKFHGLYMVNEIPDDMSPQRAYAIFNLSKLPGTHWIAAAVDPNKERSLLIYDSFGDIHKVPEEILHKYPNSTTTEPDAEQKVYELNCGARCFAWLWLCDTLGLESAAHI